MFSDEQERKKKKTRWRRHVNTQKIASGVTYSRGGPTWQSKRGATEDARKDKVENPHVSLTEEDKDETWPGGDDRPHRSAEPSHSPIQVHFEEESRPRHLITFHTCIWREPTSKTINRAHLPLIQHTHTHSPFHKPTPSLALLLR